MHKTFLALAAVSVSIAIIGVGCVQPSLPPSTASHTAVPLSPGHNDLTKTPLFGVSETEKSPPALPTGTLTPPPTSTLTPIPSWTPLPTLDQSARRQLILDLLNHNAGCQLPCWWGITPGETTWEQAKQSLALFAEEIGEVPKDEKTQLLGERSIAIHLYAVKYESPQSGTLVFTGYSFNYIGFGVEGGIVIYITVGNNAQEIDSDTAQYLLPNLLETYGVPNDTRLYVEDGPNTLEFWIGVMYEQGIIARYAYQAHREGDQYQACSQYAEPVLSLWAPDDKQLQAMFVEDMKKYVGEATLSQVTNMDVPMFYETFKNPDNKICLYSPMSLWP